MSEEKGQDEENKVSVVGFADAKDEKESNDKEKDSHKSRLRWQTAERVKSKREMMSEDEKKSYKLRRTPTMSKEVWQNVKDKDLYPIQVRFEGLNFSVLNPKKKREELGEYKTILSDYRFL